MDTICFFYLLVFGIFSLLSTPGLGRRMTRELLSNDKIQVDEMDLIGVDRYKEYECSEDAIEINQGPSSPLPSGIPTYTVQILNACVTNCNITNIHVSCGWFSSARLIDPTIFRRLAYDDCLVNDGDPLNAAQSLTFQYANTFLYPLSVSSVDCL